MPGTVDRPPDTPEESTGNVGIDLVAQIAPQRSTQYATLTSSLAPYELVLSPLGSSIANVTTVEMGGQAYLRFALHGDLDEAVRLELASLATLSAFFLYFERLETHEGPFLTPITLPPLPGLPRELATTRRYRGKTNEELTQFLCNVARASSAYAHLPWTNLRVLDPLAGGGTTLFIALTLGADAAGIEHTRQDVRSTVAFLRDFVRDQRIPCTIREERLRKLGRRWSFTVGQAPLSQHCVMVEGDTLQATQLLSGFKPHLLVTDLPYGIQHQSPVIALLSGALPVWADLLPKGGCLAFSWDATRFGRAEMVDLVETAARLEVLNESPYDQLAHGVDRVIKRRDMIVALPR